MENRFDWNGTDSDPKRKKERHAFRPTEFFGHAVSLAASELFVPERGFKRLEHTPIRSELMPHPKPIPVYSIAVEQAKIFALFMELLKPLGEDLSVILTSSHKAEPDMGPREFWSGSHDSLALQSALLDYEDLLTQDGFSGVSVTDANEGCEVMFTEDKTLHCYGNNGIMGQFHRILHRHDVYYRPELKILSESVFHVHRTTSEYRLRFLKLVDEIGALSY